MKTIAVVEMKSRLSAVLADVENGEEIAITRHGKVVARLVPDVQVMAADAFRDCWGAADIDIAAPADAPPEPVGSID